MEDISTYANFAQGEPPQEVLEILYRREFGLSALAYQDEPIDKINEYFAYRSGENKRIVRERKHGR